MYSTIRDPKPNQLMTCPYNKAHQVEHSRMQYHLQKCRKQYPNSMKQMCPFNATHVVNDAELDYHVSSCPNRGLFDTQKFVVEDEVQPRTLPPVPVVPTEENWEDEEVATYVPDLASKAHVIAKVKGAAPAERRLARMQGAQPTDRNRTPDRVTLDRRSSAPHRVTLERRSSAPRRVTLERRSSAPRRVTLERRSSAPRRVTLERRSSAPRRVTLEFLAGSSQNIDRGSF